MARFALLSPQGTDRVQPAQIVLVREHFSVWGFFLPLPYCLWHRNWRFSAVLVLLGAMMGFLPATSLPAHNATLLALELLMGLYVGFAAADIRTAALERDGYRIIDVAIAPDEDSALLRYLDHHFATARPAPQDQTPAALSPNPSTAKSSTVMPATSLSASGSADVLGLFPEARR